MSMDSHSQRVRMIDVANAAGVSTATVGRVIHNNGYVSDEARERVEQAIEETGFHLNLVAQSLRRQRTRTIGHVLTSLVPNPFFAGVEVGVEEAAVAHGYSVILWNALSDPERERQGIEAFIQRQVEAVIFTTQRDSANVQLALDAGLQVVQVERPSSVPTHKVLVDNYSGSSAAMQHLLTLGHRRIGYVGKVEPNKPQGVDSQRYNGYLDSLVAAGIQPQDRWSVLDLDVYSIEDGYRGAEQLLANDPDLTAILVFSDIMAAGVLQALYDLHLRVPDDVSVVGFDNTYAPYLTPPLTTVAIPMGEVGRTAARIAIDALEAETAPADFITEQIATELVTRQSTAAPRET